MYYNRARHQLCLLILLSLISCGAFAAIVDGSYKGVIDQDSGLGLTGETMRIDFSYDDSVAGSASGSSTFYSGLINTFSVTIGSNVWSTPVGGGSASLFLNNDDVIVFSAGTEDRISLTVGSHFGDIFLTFSFGYRTCRRS